MGINIKIQPIEKSRIGELDFNNIQFGKHYSDHQYIVDFEDGEWKNPRIVPYGNIEVSPAASALHYGQAYFEGLKAYKNEKGEVYIFRPEENWKRANTSARRMCMPEIPYDIFMEGLKELVKIDEQWIPTGEGYSLYIRPFSFATDPFVGVRPSLTYKFIIFTSPVNPFYSTALKVKVEEQYVRAAQGGTGEAKCAGNYGAAMYPTKKAQEEGFHQILWLDAKNHTYLEETGTTNVFVVINDKIITPSLDGTILAGITRNSIITLLKDYGMSVEERPISINEVIEAHQKGELKEMFGAGTAATIAKIELFNYLGNNYALPDINNWTLAPRILTDLDGIKTGQIEDKFNWMLKIK